MTIDIVDAFTSVEYQYPDFDKYIYLFISKWESGEEVPTRHKQAIWVDKSELLNYEWAEAYLPIVREYLSL